MTTEQLMKIIEADPYANVTFSGGDPMYQCDGFAAQPHQQGYMVLHGIYLRNTDNTCTARTAIRD